VFVANEILTAGAVNTNLMDQAVMVFADAAARTAALGSPSEGMVTYLEDSDSLELYTTVWGPVSPAITRADLPAGSVLQVVSVTLDTQFSATTIVPVDVTGLAATITPSSSSNKVYVAVTIVHKNSGNNSQFFQLDRNGTLVGGGGTSPNYIIGYGSATARETTSASNFLDSPATTSARTYKIRMATNASDAGAMLVNPGGIYSSTITLMEVAG
jgi:hypothetical protein